MRRAKEGSVIFLDRDGVLNDIVIDEEQGTIDSPMNPNQMKMSRGVSEALNSLSNLGYKFFIVTNQPAAAKGKTTLGNLKAAHEKLISELKSHSVNVEKSYMCLHRKEDHCKCRKPATGMFEQAMLDFPWIDLKSSWMVGDGVSDVEAGKAIGLKTAFLGPKKCDACKILESQPPEFWGKDLTEFSKSFLS